MSNRNRIELADPKARVNAPASGIVHPVPRPESGMGTLGAFALGVVTGIVGVTVAAVIVDKLEEGNGCNGDADGANSAKTSGAPDPAQNG